MRAIPNPAIASVSEPVKASVLGTVVVVVGAVLAFVAGTVVVGAGAGAVV